jgi:hypothetical protein
MHGWIPFKKAFFHVEGLAAITISKEFCNATFEVWHGGN